MQTRSLVTKREAIRECKRLWKEIEESGLSKYGFLHSPDGEKWLCKNYQDNCPLCEYASGNACDKCTLQTKYGKSCYKLDFTSHTPEWYEAVKGLKE